MSMAQALQATIYRLCSLLANTYLHLAELDDGDGDGAEDANSAIQNADTSFHAPLQLQDISEDEENIIHNQNYFRKYEITLGSQVIPKRVMQCIASMTADNCTRLASPYNRQISMNPLTGGIAPVPPHAPRKAEKRSNAHRNISVSSLKL